MRSGVGSWALGIGAALSVSASAAEQWPAWRGRDGSGVSQEKNVPTEWTPDKNIKWKVEIPGRGHSSPVVWGNLVFVTTAIKGEQVPGRKAQVHLDFQKKPGYVHEESMDIDFRHTLKVYAVNATTGAVRWERVAYDGVMFDDRRRQNTFASPTMAVDGERAYAFFESNGVYAYDLAGNLSWKKDLGTIIKAGLGPGTSPVVYKDLLILQCDQEMGDGSYIVALNRKTGDEVWRAARENRRSWATPLVVNTGARDELIASGAEMVIAYDPVTGKELWRSEGTRSHPIPSPVTTKGVIFLTAG